MKLRPINDWVLIKIEPSTQPSKTIFLTEGNRVLTAIVTDVGPGKLDENQVFQPTQVRPGEKVALFKEHLAHKQGKEIASALTELGDNYALVREMDILFVLPPTSDVRVSV